MNPQYRAMILGDELTPLSQLSSAFLAPKSALHLQFAYYESALAVEFLVRTARPARPEGLLDDLGAGVTINEALPTRTKMSLDQLDEDFAAVRPRAGRGRRPRRDLGGARAAGRRRLEGDRGLAREASQELPRPGGAWRRGSWPRRSGRRRRRPSRRSRRSIRNTSGRRTPTCCSPPSTSRLSDPAAERAALEELAARDGDASPAYLRLMELDEAAGDWKGLARDARRLLAVNPLIPAPHRELARASEQLGRPRRGARRLPRPGLARRHRPGRGPLPPGEAPAAGGQARRGPPRGPQVARGSPAVPRRPPAPARTGRARPRPRPQPPPTPTGPRAPTDDTTTPDPGSRSRCPGRSSPAWPLGAVRPPRSAAGVPGQIPDDRAGVPELEGRRAVQERRLHLRPGRVRLGRRTAGGGRRRRLGRRRLGDRLARQRPELLVPPPAAHLAQGQPRPDLAAADRRASSSTTRSST